MDDNHNGLESEKKVENENTNGSNGGFESSKSSEPSNAASGDFGQGSVPYNRQVPPTPEPVPEGLATASLVLGITGFITSCCGIGIILSIISIILGCIQKKNAYGKKPDKAVAGIVISAITLGICAVMVFMYFVIIQMSMVSGSSGNTLMMFFR